jgi:signal transduction histidine kinase
MHYTGMAAATFIHTPGRSFLAGNILATKSLGYAVTAGTLLVLCLALLSTVMDRLLSARTKRAEENERLFRESERAVVELQKERDLRERFVSALAHDLRTPLTAAKMGCQLAMRQAGNPDSVHKETSRAIQNLQRMDQMIQDMLDAHRISAGQPLPLNLEVCNVGELMESVIDDLTTIYGNRFILDAAGFIYAVWDCKYMRRAVENLLTNAVKYGDSDEKVKVAVRPHGDLPSISLSVLNKGEPLREIQPLFELFKRGPRIGKSERGWGLGLTIVKGVAEAHGGRVEVESTPAGETTFTMNLPLEPAAAATGRSQGTEIHAQL